MILLSSAVVNERRAKRRASGEKPMRTMLALMSVGVLTAASPAISQPIPTYSPMAHCFFSNELDNWKAADAKTIYIRVGMDRYFRLDLSGSCHALMEPGAFLITKIHGADSICGPLDWDLHVATSWHDIPEACIVKGMTELTPAEATALPKKIKP